MRITQSLSKLRHNVQTKYWILEQRFSTNKYKI